jgi:structural maintenance of chromosome 4
LQVNRVKAAEKERDHLEESKNEAMEYVSKEKEMLEKQSMLYQLRRAEADAKAAGVMKRKSEVEAKWKEEKERMNQLRATVNAKESEHKKEKEEFGRMAKEMGNAKADWAVYERNHIQLEQDIKHLKEKRKTLAEEIKKNEKKAQQKAEESEAAGKEADACADELDQLEAAAAEEERKLETILEGLKGETASLHDAMEVKQKEFMPFQKRLHAAQAEVDLAKSQRDLLAQRPALVAARLEEAEKQLADIVRAVADKKAQLDTARARQAEAQARAKELEKLTVRSKDEEQKLAAEVRALQSNIEHTRETAQAQTQRSALYSRLMEASRSGALKGIRGRLGDLGSIDPKYDVAISTAAPSLDHVVRLHPNWLNIFQKKCDNEMMLTSTISLSPALLTC